jgi:hypothetical protein
MRLWHGVAALGRMLGRVGPDLNGKSAGRDPSAASGTQLDFVGLPPFSATYVSVSKPSSTTYVPMWR